MKNADPHDAFARFPRAVQRRMLTRDHINGFILIIRENTLHYPFHQLIGGSYYGLPISTKCARSRGGSLITFPT